METFLTSLAAHPKLTPSAVRAAQALRDNAAQRKVRSSVRIFCGTFSGLELTVRLQWPVSARLTRPASMPDYYDRLVEGFEKSAQGIGRPWWKIFFGVW